jgi:hypothetical protein
LRVTPGSGGEAELKIACKKVSRRAVEASRADFRGL